MQLGIRDAEGKAVTPKQTAPNHPGVIEKVRPLDKASADQTGQRSGPKTEIQ
jgi:hypothetical protein